MLRQQQQKQRQAVDKVNRAIRNYNQAVKREVNASVHAELLNRLKTEL